MKFIPIKCYQSNCQRKNVKYFAVKQYYKLCDNVLLALRCASGDCTGLTVAVCALCRHRSIQSCIFDSAAVHSDTSSHPLSPPSTFPICAYVPNAACVPKNTKESAWGIRGSPDWFMYQSQNACLSVYNIPGCFPWSFAAVWVNIRLLLVSELNLIPNSHHLSLLQLTIT